MVLSMETLASRSMSLSSCGLSESEVRLLAVNPQQRRIREEQAIEIAPATLEGSAY